MTHPIGEETLTRYWLDDLDPADAEEVEAHFFGCAECTTKLRAIGELVDALRVLAAQAPPPVLTASQLETLHAGGAEVYEVRSDGAARLEVQIPRTTAVCVVRMKLEHHEEVRSVDVAFSKPDDEPFFALAGVPLEPGSDEVIIACSRHVAAAHRELRMLVRSSREEGGRVLADCTLVTRV